MKGASLSHITQVTGGIPLAQSEDFITRHGRYMTVDRRACMWCGACVGVCPQNAITLHETRIEFYDECNLCATCTRACPVGAIDMARTEGAGSPPTSDEGVA